MATWVFGPVVILSPKSPPLWGCGFDLRDLQNIHVCEFRLEFLSYLKKNKLNYWCMPPLNNFPISNWNPKLPLIIQKNEFHYKVTITSHIRDGNETKIQFNHKCRIPVLFFPQSKKILHKEKAIQVKVRRSILHP